MILVESKLGKGTSFTIHLPSTGASSLAAGVEEQVPAQAPGGGSVAVMDDEEMIRDLTGAMLTELGYQVRTCSDGAEAVELYRGSRAAGTPLSAVIMDLTIPGGMGGKEAARRILEIDPGACLIVSSGYSNDPVMSDYQSFGFCATLVKPYSAREVARVLSLALPKEGSGSPCRGG